MTIISWDDNRFLLDVEIMDDTHKEFVALVNRLAASADSEFAARFDALTTHNTAHFQQEEKLMIESRFPAFAEHRDDHLRILGEFRQFKKRVDAGLIVFARNYINARLPEWFSLHAATMDSALAVHLKSSGLDKTGS
jgi:hemerythrin